MGAGGSPLLLLVCFPSPWVVWLALASGPRPLPPLGRVCPSFLAGSFRAGLGLVRLVGPGGFGALWGGGVLALLSGIARSDGIW